MIWTVNRRIWLGFTVMLILVAAIATIGFSALRRGTANYEQALDKALPSITATDERTELNGMVEHAHQVDDAAEREIVITAIVALLIGIASAVGLSRSVIGALNETAGVLASSAAEILAATTEQAAGATESMAAVAETAATVDQVAQTSEQATQRAKAMSEAAQRAADIGKTGRKAVDDSISAMTQVQERVGSISTSIQSLAQQAQAIGDVIATVDEIAEQTNLLALNAAIEAARAGEDGRGFRVVAAEIRRLAEQSKKSTVQVRQILGDIQRATGGAVVASEEGTHQVSAGTRQVSEAGETIRSLTGVIADSAHASAQILASSGQQTAGMLQIRQAMANIQEATQQNVTASQQNEIAARNLTELGDKLLQLVGSQRAVAMPTRASSVMSGVSRPRG